MTCLVQLVKLNTEQNLFLSLFLTKQIKACPVLEDLPWMWVRGKSAISEAIGAN